MRNPVGPLPSTIYWRRRAVLLSVVALLALLVVWVVASGGGGGNNGTDGANGKDPVQTITPGPSGSGPAISQAPGGRDESGSTDTGGSDSGSGSGSAGSAGSGESGGAGGSDGSAGSGGGSGSAGTGGGTDDGANGSVGSGDTLPAGSTLPPNCTAGAVQLSLRSVQNAYAPDETPTFQLVAKNSSGNDCKIDLGVESAVVTITQASSDDEFWSSDDCPKDPAGLLFRVSAGGSITYTFEWDRKASVPECATPKAGAAEAGTYLVEAQAPGFTKAQTSFVLEKD